MVRGIATALALMTVALTQAVAPAVRVVWGQLLVHPAQIEHPLDLPDQMVGGTTLSRSNA